MRFPAPAVCVFVASLIHASAWAEEPIPPDLERRVAELASPLTRDKALEALVDARGRAVPLLVRALDRPGIEVRVWAMEALGRIRDERAVEPLAKCLDAGRTRLRMAAARALGRIGEKAALFPLVKALADEEPPVRAQAAEALGSLGSKRAVGHLVAAMEDRSYAVRVAAGRSLEWITGREFGEDAAKWKAWYEGDWQYEHASKAFHEAYQRTLSFDDGECGKAEAVFLDRPILAARFLREMALFPSSKNRKNLVRLLFALAKKLGPGKWDDAIDSLVECLSSRKSDVRALALAKIRRLGPEALPHVADWMLTGPGWGYSQGFEFLLEKGRPAVACLVEGWRRGRVQCRKTWAELLGRFGRAGSSALVEALLSDDFDGRGAILLQAFSKTGAVHVPLLLAAAGTVDEEGLDRIRAALKAVGTPGVATLAGGLGHESPAVRALCAAVLGDLHRREKVDALAPLLEDSSAEVRRKAALALGKLRDRRATKSLLPLLEERTARAEVLELLEGLRDPAAGPALARLLSRAHVAPVPVVRALAACSGKGAAEALLARLPEAQDPLRTEVVRALVMVADPAALATLEDIWKKPRTGAYEERIWVAAGLVRLRKDERCLAVLLRFLERGRRSLLSVTAEALGTTGAKEAILPLVGQILKRDCPCVEPAARALARFGPQVANEVLGFTGPTRSVSDMRLARLRVVVREIARRNPSDLLEMIDHGHWAIRKPAMRVAGEQVIHEALPALLRAPVYDHDRVVALGRLATGPAVEALVEGLASHSKRFRWVVLQSLLEAGAAAAPQLLHALKEGTYANQREAVGLMAATGDPRCVAPLVGLLPTEGEGKETRKLAEKMAAEKQAAYIHLCLRHVTGADVPPGRAAWTAWLARQRQRNKKAD